ncbi:hypothetical protein BC938DRAFT_479454 [Jimgerdemannia flammicorona]|uniref:Uncharacterized protein n=1 Tax=Jimgerdemannia flammicorona TaxID=994334 RepID=A0A433QY18_9FUNG|nr:hypothetical protein BC938DRAFT_479454 [Jimgerdemannia flammicorona]
MGKIHCTPTTVDVNVKCQRLGFVATGDFNGWVYQPSLPTIDRFQFVACPGVALAKKYGHPPHPTSLDPPQIFHERRCREPRPLPRNQRRSATCTISSNHIRRCRHDTRGCQVHRPGPRSRKTATAAPTEIAQKFNLRARTDVCVYPVSPRFSPFFSSLCRFLRHSDESRYCLFDRLNLKPSLSTTSSSPSKTSMLVARTCGGSSRA